MTEALSDTYLGLPSTMGLDRTYCFQILVDRVMKRIMGWKERQLSIGGKEVLLNSIVHAIPSYAMSVFKIPKHICKGITDAVSHYWWDDGGNQRRMRRMHWFGDRNCVR